MILNMKMIIASVLLASVVGGLAQGPAPAAAPVPAPPPATPATGPAGAGRMIGGGRLQPPGLPGLKEEQKVPIFEYNQAIGKARHDNEERLVKAKKALAEAIFGDKTDTDAVRKRMEELSKIESDIHVARAEAFAKLRPVLSPEQIASMRANFDDGSRQRIQSTVGMPFPRAEMQPGASLPLPPGGIPANVRPGLAVPPVPGSVPSAAPVPPPTPK